MKIYEAKRTTKAAQASREIKKVLMEKFTGIKFSVTSDNFSMGNSVDIAWNLGPTSDEVKKITNKYQKGDFNGMIDLYEYTNIRNDIPQAKFVSTKRDYLSAGEIENNKLPWRERKDLYGEGKRLVDDIARQICALVGIQYTGTKSEVPEGYKACYRIRGGDYLNWGELVYQLLGQTTFDSDKWEGYRVDFDTNELGNKILNKFRIIK